MRAIIFTLALAIALPGFSQNDAEALRYSMRDMTGSARFMGVGGAFSALGGDFTSASYNPAGIGLYRRSEAYFGTQFISTNTDATYYDRLGEASRFNFNVGGFGLVFNSYVKNNPNRDEKKGWLFTTFAVGMNRLSSFSNRTRFSGYNPDNSFLDSYLEEANANGGTSPGNVFDKFPFSAGLAYEAYLIDPDPQDSNQFVSKVPDGMVQQSKNIWSRGGIDEYVISFAGNYSNKYYLGATIGIPVLRYYDRNTYSEEDIDGVIPDFKSFTLSDTLITKGTGVNIKVGFSAWVTKLLRVGAAIHSPTPFFMHDRYVATLSSDVEGQGTYSISSPIGDYNYTLFTPLRFMCGFAVVVDSKGFLSADYEFQNYGQARYSFKGSEDAAFQDALNASIESKYGPSHTLRMGGELVLDAFRVRGGLHWSSPALKKEYATQDRDYSSLGWALGAGFRGEILFVDAAFTSSGRSQGYFPYTLSDPNETVEGATLQQKDVGLTLTAGVRF